MQKDTVAAFDFDGTLTYKDSLLPFLIFVKGYAITSLAVSSAIPSLVGCLFDYKCRQAAKERILKSSLSGMSLQEARMYGERYAKGPLENQIRPQAKDKLHWHLKQGHRCILISANLDLYLQPWALKEGFHDVICSTVASDSQGNLTGQLTGSNCWGEEKCRRLLQLLGSKNNFMLYAYGDSQGDKPLLELADYPFYRKF